MLPLQSLFEVMIKLGDIYYLGLHIILLLYSVSEIIMAVEIVAEPVTNYSMTLNFRANYSENYKHHNLFVEFLSGLGGYRSLAARWPCWTGGSTSCPWQREFVWDKALGRSRVGWRCGSVSPLQGIIWLIHQGTERDNSKLQLAQWMCLLQRVLEERSCIKSNCCPSPEFKQMHSFRYFKTILLNILGYLIFFWTKSLNLISAIKSSLLEMHKELASGYRFSFQCSSN